MPIIKSAPLTVIDSSTNINLELFVSSNLPTTQILAHDNTVTPSWATTPLTLTPSAYVSNTLISNPTISWQRRAGAGEYSELITGESVSNGVLTVRSNVLASESSKIITYKCTLTYGSISRFAEMTFTMNVIGADGKDGSSVTIKGTAYTTTAITNCVVGQNYTLYSDVGLTTQITGSAMGDGYLVDGFLFVYSGAANNQFNCVGNIQGVSITSITGPVSNGVTDTYTIHYSDGTTSSYDIVNGRSVYVTYNDGASQPNTPTGDGTSNGWHTNMGSASVWMSQKVADSASAGEWGYPVRIKGADGKGIVSTLISYQTSLSGSSIPNGVWQSTIPAVEAGQYLWTKTTINYTDGAITNSYTIGRIGENGTGGLPGRGINSTVVSYKAHANGTSAPSGAWSSTIPDVADDQYLWTRTVVLYTDNTTSTMYSVGKMGKSGEDGATVILTNETYTFAGSVNTAMPGSVTCNVIAYEGDEQVDATIGTITGFPTGMSTSVFNNGTLNTSFTVTVTSNMRSGSGFLTVPVTVGTKTFNKTFSYAIAFTGATGARGEDGVVFNIYSDDGTVFHADDDEITLRLHKMSGANAITLGSGTTVQWSKYVDGSWISAWKYDSGDANNVTVNEDTLLVKRSEVNGSQQYKCTLTYASKTYIDVITLTDKTDTYQSKIISTSGNILQGGYDGVTAYAALFHEANEEDTLVCPIYSEGTTPIADQIYYVLDGDNYLTKKYVDNAWIDDDTLQQSHMYTWVVIDKYTGDVQDVGSGKVVHISNDIISGSGIVQCKIDNISVCTEVFTDINDPIVSATEPITQNIGQLWFNTSDNLLYAYRDDNWNPVNSGQNRTYTSAPIVFVDCCYYKAGDLWIVGENDSAYTDAKAGTLLVATNHLRDGADGWSAATWKDRLAIDWDNKLYYDEELVEITDYQNKISAYVNFDYDGMKIGATNTEFYTKVTPYDLGFYQGSEKVAYVSNKKMYNTSLEVSNDVQVASHKSDDQTNPQKPYFMLGNFKFIMEENGSMSIARSLMRSPQPRVKGYEVLGNVITIYFTPWSSNNNYGYRSNHNSAAISNIKLLDENGTVLSRSTSTGSGWIKVTSTNALPTNVVVQLPENIVYNIGQSNSDYDLTSVGNDAITLAIATNN